MLYAVDALVVDSFDSILPPGNSHKPPSILSSGVTQINILVGTIIASFEASAVSYLYYADRIYQINLAIAGIPIGVVILPPLSKHIQSKKKKRFC